MVRKKRDTSIKKVVNKLGLTAEEFYAYCNSDVAKMGYHRQHNKKRYEDMILAGIANYFGVGDMELIDVLLEAKNKKEEREEDTK